MILDPSPDGRWMHGLSESPFYVKRDHAQPFGEMKVLTFLPLFERERADRKKVQPNSQNLESEKQ